MEVPVGGDVLELYAREEGNVLQWLGCPVKVGRGGGIGDGPVVIGVTVRVECDLLFWGGYYFSILGWDNV